MKTVRSTLVALLGLAVAAAASGAQESPAGQETETPQAEGAQQPRRLEPPHSTELVFEREVFDYPTFPRRNPFVALVATQSGPRFEQIRLRGIIYMDPPAQSVALLGIGTTSGQQQPRNGTPETGVGDQSRRVREGESWGNVRVLEIRRSEILVRVEEFGLTEERIMRLPTRGQGD